MTITREYTHCTLSQNDLNTGGRKDLAIRNTFYSFREPWFSLVPKINVEVIPPTLTPGNLPSLNTRHTSGTHTFTYMQANIHTHKNILKNTLIWMKLSNSNVIARFRK